jgi:hypothetical protein
MGFWILDFGFWIDSHREKSRELEDFGFTMQGFVSEGGLITRDVAFSQRL